MTLEIKAGVAYRTRDGDRVVLTEFGPVGEFIFYCDEETYTAQGKVFMEGSHPDDIVALWDEPKPIPTIYDSIALLEGRKDCLTAIEILRTHTMKLEANND